MSIQRWDIAEIRKLVEMYNCHIADVPYTPQVSASELCTCANLNDPCLSNQRLLVGLDGGQISGFAHVAKYTPEDGASGNRTHTILRVSPQQAVRWTGHRKRG